MIFAVGSFTLGSDSVASDAETFPHKMIWSVPSGHGHLFS